MNAETLVAGFRRGDLTLAECEALIDTLPLHEVDKVLAALLPERDALVAGYAFYDTTHGLIDLRGVHLAESFDHHGILFAAVDTGTYGYAWGIVADGWLAVAGDSLTVGELGSLETWAADTSAEDWGRWAARAFERRLVAR